MAAPRGAAPATDDMCVTYGSTCSTTSQTLLNDASPMSAVKHALQGSSLELLCTGWRSTTTDFGVQPTEHSRFHRKQASKAGGEGHGTQRQQRRVLHTLRCDSRRAALSAPGISSLLEVVCALSDRFG